MLPPAGRRIGTLVSLGIGILWGGCQGSADTGGQDLAHRALPILQERCHGCHSHGADRIRGGLMLDSRAGAVRGGDSGRPALTPQRPGESGLLDRIRSKNPDHRMPPEGDPLTPEQATVLEDWIRHGAPWPEAPGMPPKRPAGPITGKERDWWSFQPLARVEVPPSKDSPWPRNEIDHFILERLQQRGLVPSPEADRLVLIRRLSFDLWGLPPDPSEIDSFLHDPRPDAYEQLVDRLLASPHYGERWARHWLDLVRYADSDGYKADDLRPTAWRYRNYVIDSLNGDKPYDRFVQEQLAGDELFPDEPEALAATGYFRSGIYEYNNRDAAGQWTAILNDITDTTGDVFLGLGFQCARCHDHKFDPILQKDYYRLQAFFAGIQWHDDLPIATARSREEHDRKLSGWREQTAGVRAEIESLLAPYRDRAASNAVVKFPPAIQAILRKPEPERSPLERQIGALAYRQISYEHERLASQLKPADRERHDSLRRGLAEFDALQPPPLPVTLTVRDVGPIAPEVFIPRHPEEPIPPGFPSVLDPTVATVVPIPGVPGSTGRRAALARWLTRPENPLTTRVLVNRVWQQHFGLGLVATGNDFGRLGERPLHPELLDWLARRFTTEGWSLKSLHRLILTSATYRQASSPSTVSRSGPATEMRERWRQALLADPDNRLLWRGPSRRLDAEQIRDALLAATGELVQESIEGAADPSQFRRSIHSKILRNSRDPVLDVFDTPQQFASTASRDTTTTPIQSLLLINSPFMVQRSRAMASRLEKASGGREAEAITLAYLSAFGRKPNPEELAKATEFLHGQERRVDPDLALSATAGFRSDRMPFREGRVAVLAPKTPQETLTASLRESAPFPTLTFEAFVLLRSLPEDGAPRMIASLGDGSRSGWSLGVTGRRSPRRPQSLMVQLHHGTNSEPAIEEIVSDLIMRPDKPCYVGITLVGHADGRPPRIVFHLKDLSNDEEPLQTVEVEGKAGWIPSTEPILTLGGKKGGVWSWDGYLDEVRLTASEISTPDLQWVREGALPQTIGLWSFEPRPGYLHDSSGHGHSIQSTQRSGRDRPDARMLALSDLCHALLNSNEFLYLE